jgi:hypothetical protein
MVACGRHNRQRPRTDWILYEVVLADALATGVLVLAAGEIPRTIRWMPTHPPSRDAPAMDHHAKASQYEVHISGLLGERLLTAFPELHARTLENVTVLVGDLPDQAALHGVLSRIESLGLELLEVRRCSYVRTRWVPPGRGGT